MIKIKINRLQSNILGEARTIPVSQHLVSSLTDLYTRAFIKLIEVYIEDERSTADRAGKKFFDQLEIELGKKYPTSSAVPIDKQFLYDLISRMNRPNRYDRHRQISEIPVDTLLQIIKNDPGEPLEKFLGGKIPRATAIRRIKKYFDERDIGSLSLGIELQKTAQANAHNETAEPGEEIETYAGLYFAESGTVSISFEAGFFTGTIITDSDGRRLRISPRLGAQSGKRPETIIGYIEDELRELSISIRHELQHFYQSLFSKVFGVADFRAGLPPRQVTKRHLRGDAPQHHFSDPVEMQTDIQDEVDKFAVGLGDMMNQWGDSLAGKEQKIKDIKKTMIKIFVDSALSDGEKDIQKSYKLYKHVEPSKLFRDIKSNDPDGELYRYALRILTNSVADIFTESKMKNNKINILISEGKNEKKTISENITKEEVRKIVRDEIEKLFHNKENKKEIADITKKMLKKLYRELSYNSTYIIDQIEP